MESWVGEAIRLSSVAMNKVQGQVAGMDACGGDQSSRGWKGRSGASEIGCANVSTSSPILSAAVVHQIDGPGERMQTVTLTRKMSAIGAPQTIHHLPKTAENDAHGHKMIQEEVSRVHELRRVPPGFRALRGR